MGDFKCVGVAGQKEIIGAFHHIDQLTERDKEGWYSVPIYVCNTSNYVIRNASIAIKSIVPIKSNDKNYVSGDDYHLSFFINEIRPMHEFGVPATFEIKFKPEPPPEWLKNQFSFSTMVASDDMEKYYGVAAFEIGGKDVGQFAVTVENSKKLK